MYLLRTKSVVSPYRGTSDRRMYGLGTVRIRFGYGARGYKERADWILFRSAHILSNTTKNLYYISVLQIFFESPKQNPSVLVVTSVG